MDNSVAGKCMTLSPCEKRICTNVTIVAEENVPYNVPLERTPDLHSNIMLDPAVGVVKITNSDGRYT